jgi:hypothetical protein
VRQGRTQYPYHDTDNHNCGAAQVASDTKTKHSMEWVVLIITTAWHVEYVSDITII